jgi:Thioredoxin reductase
MNAPQRSHLTRRRFLQSAAATAATAAFAPRLTFAASTPAPAPSQRVSEKELHADVLIVGGSFGGVSAALAAARMGRSVILTEETRWIGGQATTQGVPPDEHPWIEDFGRTRSYAEYRTGVREYYRRHYPLTDKARSDPHLNPGAAWVSAFSYEPRVGLAVLETMLAPHLGAGRIRLFLRHRPTAVHTDGDRVQAVSLRDDETGRSRTFSGTYILDATELGELLELGKIEHVIGAESQAETGEPNALEGPADPRDQMGFTHCIAMDYLPGEEHVIDKPRDYDRWRNARKLVVPDLFGHKQDYFRRPVTKGPYVAAPWSFRRFLCRTNFQDGAFPSDITVPIWSANEYHAGVLCGVPPEERRRHLDAARQLSLSLLYYLQTEAPDPATGRNGFPGLRPRGDVFGTADGLAQYPYIRESARIRAELTVVETMFRNDLEPTRAGPVKFADSVGVGGYRIDIHKPAKKGAGSMTGQNHGKHWCQQIPLGALIPVRVENLLPACKNLGVSSVVNGAFRLHPNEWNIGEAAGALAAFCIDRNLSPRQVRNTPRHLADFQRELVRQGVELDWPAGHRETGRSYYSHHDKELQDLDTFYFGEAWRL